jgi:hypothetical protein
MSYINLKNFSGIFNREDFNYICNHTNINRLDEIFLYHIRVLDRNEWVYIELLERFLKNLDSFHNWIRGNIPGIEEGYAISRAELMRSIRLLKLPEHKRISVSRGYIKKFNKSFLYGLSKLLEGIRLALDPSVISTTSIDKSQLVRYFLDKKEGLGNKFLFNDQGKHAAANKLESLNRNELIETMKLLLKQSRVRTTRNGWIDLGSGNMPIRVLLVKHKLLGIFGRDIVGFVFKVKEHREYGEMLNTPSKRMSFSFA